ncbi:indolepyruvate oxidoreductase subunit beta [Desulfovibrio oxyclinae]|uniref:indolepyruvate oxidoreductase subunit beta n=1 Tax=Desulfovibrio oxyclinae TaxID=63560 RepID=UPI0003737138|nr:indolepyruvate oxidoreductase subunit beta [Desulfovibrio oxyclinae]
MSDIKPIRIFMTGVGGQGTLTATTLLANTVLSLGLPVTSGEIHGMAQRGGVVESTVLIGCKSPKIGHGEADVMLGFEPTETMRALPYLKSGGSIFSSSEYLLPLSVATGRESCPELSTIEEAVKACTEDYLFLPCQTLGIEAGAVQAGNIALLGAMAASGKTPITVEALADTIRKSMKPKIVDVNLKALELGAAKSA